MNYRAAFWHVIFYYVIEPIFWALCTTVILTALYWVALTIYAASAS